MTGILPQQFDTHTAQQPAGSASDAGKRVVVGFREMLRGGPNAAAHFLLAMQIIEAEMVRPGTLDADERDAIVGLLADMSAFIEALAQEGLDDWFIACWRRLPAAIAVWAGDQPAMTAESNMTAVCVQIVRARAETLAAYNWLLDQPDRGEFPPIPGRRGVLN